MRWLASIAVACSACAPIDPTGSATSSGAPASRTRTPQRDAPAPLRALDVLERRNKWLDRELIVDIFEPIRDEMHSSAAPPGGFDVEVADAGTATLNLVPDGRHVSALPSDLAPPFRVRATLRRNDARERMSGRRWRVLEVHEISPLSYPTPQRAPSAAAILRARKQWHDRFVELEGPWYTGFEISSVDGIWIDVHPDAHIECLPADVNDHRDGEYTTRRVRLVGFVHTKGRYGHLGIADVQLTATRVVFLDTPGCTPAAAATKPD